jgi:hypothetical protein
LVRMEGKEGMGSRVEGWWGDEESVGWSERSSGVCGLRHPNRRQVSIRCALFDV